MSKAEEVAPMYGVYETCDAMGLSTATFYRRRKRAAGPPCPAARVPPRKLSAEEEQAVLNTLNSERFMDQAVPEVYATLLDEGSYLCSCRTMYRILNRNQLVRERRHERHHPAYEKPELLATGPNQVWSWDITKIKGPKPWIFYNLYVVLDVFSRYVVGWTICDQESGEQARALLEACYEHQSVQPGQLKVHSDRGRAMRSKPLAELLADLQVTRSFTRPHVSNDNPYSESQFKTLKYHPTFPERFGSIEDARSYLRAFFKWYNTEHRHSGLALMTPEVVHLKKDQDVWTRRKQILVQVFQKHPERFVKGEPEPRKVPEQVWINQPKEEAA